MSVETKSIDINIDYDECCRYGAIYCYDIIYWNLKHCLTNSNSIMIDNIRCFDIKSDMKACVSIYFNIRKKELTFSCNILKDLIYQEIKNKEIYDSFTIENFTKQFITFSSLVSDFAKLKDLQYCNDCNKATYQLTFKHLCNRCHITSITLVNCYKCKKEAEIRKTTEISENIKGKKQGRFKRLFSKLKFYTR